MRSRLALAAVLLLGCHDASPPPKLVQSPAPPPPDPPAPTFAVRGHVLDASHHPVPNAQVVLSAFAIEAHVQTDATGAFALRAEPGAWSVSAHATNQTGAFVAGVRVGSGDVDGVELVLDKPEAGAAIEIHVTHRAPLPPGAAIEIARTSEDVGDTWYAPIDPATDIARAIVPHATSYFAFAERPLSGRIDIPDPAHPPALDVVVFAPPSDAVRADVRARAVDLADLAGFGKLVGDTPIVAVGEATHGTHEFFALKHRLFEYLASEKGFTTFAFEADQAECRAIDRYVQGGDGTARAVVGAISIDVWRTEELVAFVDWMRAYNSTPGHARVHFVGFDMQSWRAARVELGAFLARVDPTAAEALTAEVYTLDKTISGQDVGDAFDQLSEPRKAGIGGALSAAADAVAAHKADADYSVAAVDVASLREWYAFNRGGTSDELRDRAMADNLRALRPGAGKMMIWAHNMHVGRYTDWAMGTLLQQAWGADYLPIGVVFGGGTFLARGLTAGGGYTALVDRTFGPASSIDAVAPLSALGAPLVALDLRGVPATAPAATWFASAHPQRETGWLLESEAARTHDVVLRDRFDALIYVAHSSSSHLLP